jgi:hypothetical protein
VRLLLRFAYHPLVLEPSNFQSRIKVLPMKPKHWILTGFGCIAASVLTAVALAFYSMGCVCDGKTIEVPLSLGIATPEEFERAKRGELVLAGTCVGNPNQTAIVCIAERKWRKSNSASWMALPEYWGQDKRPPTDGQSAK